MSMSRRAILVSSFFTVPGIIGGSNRLALAQEPCPRAESSKDAEPPASKRSKFGYNNGEHFLTEGAIPVTDNYGKRATHENSNGKRGEALPDVALEFVWCSPFDKEFEFPELHHGMGLYRSEYPSRTLFFERKLEVKRIKEISVPETPYSFYILDGEFVPYFRDSKKDVIWRLNNPEMDALFGRMKSLSVSPKKLEFVAPGGDMAEFLTIDFSSRNASPAISTWRTFHGP